MNRKDLQKFAEIRIQEARILLNNARYEGAYYLAGYSVECALKACIAKQIKEHDFPDRKLILDSYTHDLNKLLGLAGVRRKYERRAEENEEFRPNWAIVKDWSEQDRYTTQIDERRARNLIEAINDRRAGVLTWLKNCW